MTADPDDELAGLVDRLRALGANGQWVDEPVVLIRRKQQVTVDAALLDALLAALLATQPRRRGRPMTGVSDQARSIVELLDHHQAWLADAKRKGNDDKKMRAVLMADALDILRRAGVTEKEIRGIRATVVRILAERRN
ncbi:hypothetical protein RB623_10985 [Mesorhizobium sp. LHD-90]|uniref:hypothetical protein n=1 Tax=Mesorhizobium sp. LHD-90 TaxID=3071414 RepID=UPI0027E16DD2|nr:hypothetical protein [Mesorhizobium sp. LHD-90]MDQ6434571.1 hypothetical protein [Mesorhizobium sp. LHD-90]